MKTLARYLAMLLMSGAVVAQSPAVPRLPAGMPDPHEMMKAMEAAQAAAIQPGDDALSCAQLESKLMATIHDKAFQAYVQSAGLAAQKDLAAVEHAQKNIARKSAVTAAASIVPGAGMGNLARMTQGQEALRFMPLIMRAQRLVELGVVKRCAWTATALPGWYSPSIR